MPRLPVSELALRRALASQKAPSYICRQCLAHQSRTLHTNPQLRAEEPFWKRLQKGLFGSQESKEAATKRDESTEQRFKDLQERGQVGKMQYETDDWGNEWEYAPVVDSAAVQGYVQVTEGSGLESIGGEEWIRRRRDRGEVYVGFAPKIRHELSDQEWRGVMHHVAVEILALYQAGRDLEEVCYPRSVNLEHWDLTAGVQLAEKDGKIVLQFSDEGDKARVLDAIPRTVGEPAAEPTAETEEGLEQRATEVQDSAIGDKELDLEAKETRNQIKSAVSSTPAKQYESWLQIPLTEPALKLAIVKRATQLTGHRLPDHALSTATSVSDLWNAYKTKPKPAKLAQDRKLQTLSQGAPNVTVYSRRRTPIDKEKEVGRWKVIEEELVRRNLPVTGSRYQGAKTITPMP